MDSRLIRTLVWAVALWSAAHEISLSYARSQRESFDCQKEAYLWQKAQVSGELQRLNREPKN